MCLNVHLKKKIHRQLFAHVYVLTYTHSRHLFDSKNKYIHTIDAYL